MTPELQFALDTVRRACALARKVRVEMAGKGLTKADLSPVTVGDFAIQALVGEALARTFPGDAMMAEESGEELCGSAPVYDAVTGFIRSIQPDASGDDVLRWIDHGSCMSAGRTWVLDPIDGTKGYLRGGQYAVALALLENGRVTLGVLGCPELASGCRPELWGDGVLAAAVRGDGAWAYPIPADAGAPERIRVSECADIASARLLRSFEAAHTNVGRLDRFAELGGITADPVPMDSQAKYAVLAAGHGEILLRLLSPDKPDYREKVWDQAAGSIVLEEAGGRVTDLFGQPLDFTHGRTLAANRGLLATNGLLHDDALEVLGRVASMGEGS